MKPEQRKSPRPSQPFGPRPDADQRPGYEGDVDESKRQGGVEKQPEKQPNPAPGSRDRKPA